ncbi:MAG: MetQ/NlpA family ABC transporter substrate-binding protein [Fusobacteriaceae bacterium]|jgi:D-methionine transport system substrate-binding protein|nr:MetQ/NlpA family ABC transporter substrate-binding protein [Fusobacteriaceae bacterium]
MKKILLLLALTLSLAAFAGKLKVGASPVPHAELLNLVKDDLKAQGVDLEVIEINDYVTPNLLLADGSLDLNYFQSQPYLDKFAEERKLNLVGFGKIHVEPLGFYSKKYKKVEDIPEGATITIPNDPTNEGRALILFHSKGLIKLKDPTNLYATEFDIVENPKKFVFKTLEAAQLPRALDDADATIINGNYAIPAGLKPDRDALFLEDKDSPYANLLTSRPGDENKEDVQKLVKALQSEKVRKYILDNYNGGVVPAF